MPNCPHCDKPLDIKIYKAVTVEEVQKILDEIGDTAGIEVAKDREFVESVRARIATYRERTRITVPQLEWLTEIRDRKGELPF